jgi:hypothetical protein
VRIQELIEGIGTMAKTMTFETWQLFDGLRLPARSASEDQTNGKITAETSALETHVTFP